jgi:hypothetical protein
VLPAADRLTVAQLRLRVRRALARLDSAALELRRAEAASKADVCHQPTGDGMSRLMVDLPVPKAAGGGCLQVAVGDPITDRLVAVATRSELRRGSGRGSGSSRRRRGADDRAAVAAPETDGVGLGPPGRQPVTARPHSNADSSAPATVPAACPAAGGRQAAATSTTASPTPTAGRPPAGTSAIASHTPAVTATRWGIRTRLSYGPARLSLWS